jgi:hypothetical protein
VSVIKFHLCFITHLEEEAVFLAFMQGRTIDVVPCMVKIDYYRHAGFEALAATEINEVL